MARMAPKGQQKQKRRSFTDEFKAGAVALVLDQDKTVASVARDLDLTPSALTAWVKQARADRSKGATGLTTRSEPSSRASARTTASCDSSETS